MKKIRLTESDLHRIIKESAQRILKEYIGDEEELGRYDLEDYDDLPFGTEKTNIDQPTFDEHPISTEGWTEEELYQLMADRENAPRSADRVS